MSLFGKIGGAIKKIGGAIKTAFSYNKSDSSREYNNYYYGSNEGSSGSNTTYEPDKVKIAEIERDLKIKLADMDQDKIKLIKDAKLELLENEYYLKMALEEARAKGLTCIAQTILAMQDKLNEIAVKRLEIIEQGSLNLIKEIENFYDELGDKINNDQMEYNKTKLPILLNTMEQFEKDSDSYNLYKSMIEKDMANQLTMTLNQLDGISKRQSKVLESLLKSKDTIINQTSSITQSIVDQIAISYNQNLELGNNFGSDTFNEEFLLENKEKLLIQNNNA